VHSFSQTFHASRSRGDHTSSRLDCLALLALKVELASLTMESSFGRGICEDDASVKALAGRLLFGVPRWVPVVDMLAGLGWSCRD
jgi:hypothetical protein